MAATYRLTASPRDATVAVCRFSATTNSEHLHTLLDSRAYCCGKNQSGILYLLKFRLGWLPVDIQATFEVALYTSALALCSRIPTIALLIEVSRLNDWLVHWLIVKYRFCLCSADWPAVLASLLGSRVPPVSLWLQFTEQFKGGGW